MVILLALVVLLALAVQGVSVRHTVANVTIYPSYDSVGVPVVGNRLLFAGGKSTNR